MARKSTKEKSTPKPKMSRENRRVRMMSYVFLGISLILILSMVLSMVAK
ncbi:MAG: hypothetical protein QMD04_05165 [Anaerolineales bacterium]|nr:hypothetical protein [Anaerolineales bacterium]